MFLPFVFQTAACASGIFLDIPWCTQTNRGVSLTERINSTVCHSTHSFSSVFVSITLLYQLILKGCSYKSESFQRDNLFFLFSGGRTPERYTRHNFGARNSTSANYALQRTAMDNKATVPDAASSFLEKF